MGFCRRSAFDRWMQYDMRTSNHNDKLENKKRVHIRVYNLGKKFLLRVE